MFAIAVTLYVFAVYADCPDKTYYCLDSGDKIQDAVCGGHVYSIMVGLIGAVKHVLITHRNVRKMDLIKQSVLKCNGIYIAK